MLTSGVDYNRRMRITFIQSSLWLSGGARIVIEHGNLLAERGHQVSVVIPAGAIDPEMLAVVQPGLRIIEAAYPLLKPSVKKTGLWDRLRLLAAMTAAVPKSDIIVATHTPTTLVSLLAGKLLGRGLPVWFYQDYPAMFEGRRVEAWLLRVAHRWHRGAVVVSHFSAGELRELSGMDVRYVGQILNDHELFEAQRRAGARAGGGSSTIMYLGDFRPRKGLADFLAAVRIVHERRGGIRVRLVLKEGGEIELEAPHEVILRPDTPTLARCYGESDLFVSASWHEGFGLPPLEAMACGTPVVLSDSGGARDYARDEGNCLLVPPRDPEAMAEAILRVLSEPGLAARFREAGPETAAAFTPQQAAGRMEAALTEFLESPS